MSHSIQLHCVCFYLSTVSKGRTFDTRCHMQAVACAAPTVTPAVRESSKSPECGGVGLSIGPFLFKQMQDEAEEERLRIDCQYQNTGAGVQVKLFGIFHLNMLVLGDLNTFKIRQNPRKHLLRLANIKTKQLKFIGKFPVPFQFP